MAATESIFSANPTTAVGTLRTYRNLITTANYSTTFENVAKIRVQFKTAASYSYDIDGASIGLRSGSTEDYQSGKFTRLTFNSGSNSVSIPANSTQWSDWVEIDWFDDTVDMFVHIDPGANYTISATATGDCYRKLGDFDDCMVADVSGYSSAAFYYLVADIEVEEAAATDTNLFDGKIVIKDAATNLFDGKITVNIAVTNLFDGKALVKSAVSNLFDGKAVVKAVATVLFDGKCIVATTTDVTDYFDGKIVIKDAATNLFDGKTVIQNVAADLFDGLLVVSNAATGLFDGSIVIKDATTNLFDGKTVIQNVAADLFDGRLAIPVHVTNLLDGKVFLPLISSDELDGVLIVANFEQLFGNAVFMPKEIGASFAAKVLNIAFASKKPIITIE